MNKFLGSRKLLNLYALGIFIIVFYYIFSYLHIHKDLYIMPWFCYFINILMFTLFFIVPIVIFFLDLWKIEINIILKILISSMSFILMIVFILLVMIILNLFNPMVLKDEKITYNNDTGMYDGHYCNFLNKCSDNEYVSYFIFLKKK